MSCNSENSDYFHVQLFQSEVFLYSFGNVALLAHVVSELPRQSSYSKNNESDTFLYMVTHCFISQGLNG